MDHGELAVGAAQLGVGAIKQSLATPSGDGEGYLGGGHRVEARARCKPDAARGRRSRWTRRRLTTPTAWRGTRPPGSGFLAQAQVRLRAGGALTRLRGGGARNLK